LRGNTVQPLIVAHGRGKYFSKNDGKPYREEYKRGALW